MSEDKRLYELDALLHERWILKEEDKETYYKIRRKMDEIRSFATDKLGCQVIENSLLVKLEKIPSFAHPSMGIREFSSPEEYAYLCVLLMFLEDKDPEFQFILQSLTEYIEAEMPVDWTLYSARRKLIRVLRYAVSRHMLSIVDGREEDFADSENGQVLYENTGTSRYFMRTFSQDISSFTDIEDFGESDWSEMDEDKGIARRHRVYKRLLFSPGMYRNEGSEEDFTYLRNYRGRIGEELESILGCRLDVHRDAAFVLVFEDNRMAEVFPGNSGISDAVLLVCAGIRKAVSGRQEGWQTDRDGSIRVNTAVFDGMVKDLFENERRYFPKVLREMKEQEFADQVKEEMRRLTLIKEGNDRMEVVIQPSAGKISGRYTSEVHE